MERASRGRSRLHLGGRCGQLTEDIAELRDEGGIPANVRTVIEILPQQRVLEIRVEGLSVEADPDRTTIREPRCSSWPATSTL